MYKIYNDKDITTQGMLLTELLGLWLVEGALVNKVQEPLEVYEQGKRSCETECVILTRLIIIKVLV